MEHLIKMLDIPILKETVIFIIIQVITYFFIQRKRNMKIDINVLIKKIEDKIIKKGMCFLPEISKSTRNRINRKNKTLLNEIDNFLEKPLGIKELNIQSQDLINKLKNIV